MRRGLSCLALLSSLILGSVPALADMRLTVAQTRILANDALARGDTATAIAAARGLLQADPEDVQAYFILSTAHAAQGDLALGRKAAGYAYRFAETGPQKIRAGEQAARIAAEERRFGLAQVWLRRTAIHLQDDSAKDRLARDYGALRRANPFNFRLTTAIRPSSNVNNGANAALQVIEGIPVTGFLNGAAQALSGTIATADLNMTYRLQGSDRAETILGLRLYTKHVALSSAAQALSPASRNSDFSAQAVDVSIRHGRKAERGHWGTTLATGQARSGKRSTYRFVRLGVDRTMPLGDGHRIGLRAALEDRMSLIGTRYDATATTLGLSYSLPLGQSGDRLGLSLGLRDTDARFTNDVAQTVSLRASYDLGQPVGPARLNAALTLGYADHPLYRSGPFVVPGGRQDRSAHADLTMTFDDWDYAGFVPSIQVRAGRTTSNDSRFTTRELSLSFGIDTKF